MNTYTHILVELDVLDLDKSAAKLGLDLVRVELARLYEVADGPLEREREEPGLDGRRDRDGRYELPKHIPADEPALGYVRFSLLLPVPQDGNANS